MSLKSNNRKHSYEEIISKRLTEEEVIKNNKYTYLNDPILYDKYKPTLLKLHNHFEYYETKTDKNASIEQSLHPIEPYLDDLINKPKVVMHNIRLHMNIFYLRPDRDDIM